MSRINLQVKSQYTNKMQPIHAVRYTKQYALSHPFQPKVSFTLIDLTEQNFITLDINILTRESIMFQPFPLPSSLSAFDRSQPLEKDESLAKWENDSMVNVTPSCITKYQ